MIKKMLYFMVALSMTTVGITSLSVNASSRTDACKLMQGSASKSAICQDGGDIKSGIVPNIINFLIRMAGALSVLLVVYAGFIYTTSAGDSSKITKAKKIIIFAIIGLLVSISASVIVGIVLSRLNE